MNSFKIGDWIVVIYDHWYPGFIEKITDGLLTTKFLTRTKNGFCLATPMRPEDTQDTSPEQVLCKIEPPMTKLIRKKHIYIISKDQEIFIKNKMKNNVVIY